MKKPMFAQTLQCILFAFIFLISTSTADTLFRIGSTSKAFVHGQPIRGYVRWFSIWATPALSIATIYLAWWGVIGIRTWN